MNASNNPKWAVDFYSREFTSSSRMLEDGKTWCNQAKQWFKDFCNEVGAKSYEFHIGHYEFSGFFELDGQYWYFSSGDVRYKIHPYLLIRKAKHNKDYTGGMNQYVKYHNKNFKFNLTMIVKQVMFYEYTELR